MFRPRLVYTEEFRSEAVKLLKTSDRSVRDVADSLGVSVWTLREWYRKSEMPKKAKKEKLVHRAAAPADETGAKKVARLERENADLRRKVDTLQTDREILKKAAAFFAKENE